MNTKKVDPAKRPVQYFISYARMDAGLAESLVKPLTTHLSISKRFAFSPWRDTLLLPGEDWDHEIHQAMEDCLVGVLLVSPAFLSRPYIREVELPRLLRQDKVMIPVMLQTVDPTFHDMRHLERLQIYRLDGKAFLDCAGRRQDKDRFVRGLYEAIEMRLAKVLGLRVQP